MWILIIVIMNLSYGLGDVQTQEFTSRHNCLVAKQEVEKLKRGLGNKNLRASCVEK